MLSIAVFSHLIIMHSFHNGLEAKVKLVSDCPICVSNEPNYSYNNLISNTLFTMPDILHGGNSLFDDNINWILDFIIKDNNVPPYCVCNLLEKMVVADPNLRLQPQYGGICHLSQANMHHHTCNVCGSG